MKDLFGLLFSTEGFPPRWHCGDWSALHGWTHICSDASIFGAYAAIPAALIYFTFKRKDVPFLPIFWLFGVFILACGTGHLIEATLFWHPWYRLSAAVKVVTALASWCTVVALVRVLPQALELPGLAKLNRELSHEVGERRKAMAELRRAEASESAILKAALDAIISIDIDGRVVAWNQSAERLFGYSAKEAIGRHMDELIIPPALRPRHRAGLQRMMAGGEAQVLGHLLEMPAIRANGTELIVELFITRIDVEGPAHFTGFLRDITGRKQIDAQRVAALEESEMLLREVHHRVKNNMQVVSSLLRLHSGKLRDSAQLAVLADCRDRIQAMALIHERLYTTGKFARHRVWRIPRRDGAHDAGIEQRRRAGVNLDLQLDPLELQLDTAVPLSLIASELVLNALKHAFASAHALAP